MTKSSNNIPTNPYNDQYSSLIRPIKIYLPKHNGQDDNDDYKKHNKQDDNDDHKYDDFVGRERLMERLYNWLSAENQESGSYLVTGFRGMGKTKLVERVVSRLTREVKEKQEPWWRLLLVFPVIVAALAFACIKTQSDKDVVIVVEIALILVVWLIVTIVAYYRNKNYFIREKKKHIKDYPNSDMFDDEHVDKMARGSRDKKDARKYNNIKISINLGHEVLRERDVLSMIATSVKETYRTFVESVAPHIPSRSPFSLLVSLLTISVALNIYFNIDVTVNNNNSFNTYNTTVAVQGNVADSRQYYLADNSRSATNQQFIVNGGDGDSWLNRVSKKVMTAAKAAIKGDKATSFVFRFLFVILLFLIFKWISQKLFLLIPFYSVPKRALRRLDILTERLNTITGEETGFTPTANNGYFSFTLFNRRKQKTKPIADIREIETELADIINMINSDKCPKGYQANFIVVFDEMDKIDPDMVEPTRGADIPEFTDSVKGFPSGLESRERRQNVLKLLANIKLFVSTAKAKFVFISGRELYDAYLADLSDRDFAISSIFTGVLNVDSFLTPEGGQTDVRSMSEWYIANRLIPKEWLRKVELRNAEGRLKGESNRDKEKSVLKKEMPSLRWYYEYLVEECNTPLTKATYVIGFLHIFAAYLTHISNGSPKKIFLYFEKYIRLDKDCLPMNEWGDVLSVGRPDHGKDSLVLYFEPIQQKTINFVYYLAGPIMGTITNDLSNFGDRFLVSLSFAIDHIFKHHNRSFSWRNMEQIPELLKTSKAPELRDSVMSIMEYLTQTHISPILIGLNEYKFHKSIAEEISVISKMSDEASAIFNFTLDESLSVIQHNTRLLNHYMELDKPDREAGNNHRQYLAIIARIHSNLGDLHFWDEDYYAASLEYRAAIDAFSKDDTVWGFLTRIRCILKLGLTYESRKLFPNAYQLYGQLMELLIKKRWINENEYGLSVKDQYVDEWRGKRQVLTEKHPVYWIEQQSTNFEKQFNKELSGYDEKTPNTYSVNVDGLISSFAEDLTEEKTATINSLSLFEEVRYVYQAILAKLSVLEKMGMSGITQTNIDVAEGEFKAIHKSVNIKEKFIISADFFRKLAEILYYKNSLTILTQKQDSFYASVYYNDYDLMENLNDYCLHGVRGKKDVNVIAIKHDVKAFFYNLYNVAASDSNNPKFEYDSSSDRSSYSELFEVLMQRCNNYVDSMIAMDVFEENARKRVIENVSGYLQYNQKVSSNNHRTFFYGGVEDCDYHSRKMRECGHRPPCYACKYYTRSLRILAENMFSEKDILSSEFTRSFSILKNSFKTKLLYTRSIHINILGQTLEGFGNVMLSCAAGNNLEWKGAYSSCGISADLVGMIKDLFKASDDKEEFAIMEKYKRSLRTKPLSRLDKSILYYYDAYRFYIMDSCHNEAAGCLNKIINLLAYYIEVLCYYDGGEVLGWNKAKAEETVKAIIGDKEFHGSILAILFRFVARHTSYKYDLTNLSEISELKWIYSKDIRDNIDLTRLSLYPAIRSAWLRVVEIRAKGLHFLKKNGQEYGHEDYLKFIKLAYPLIAPKDRFRTTYYEEVLGYYTKMRFNDHILVNILGGNPMLDENGHGYSNTYHILFYQKLAQYLESQASDDCLDCYMFDTGADVDKRLKLIEFLVLDTLICITNMVKFFVPHNNLSSYSNSFIGIVYNYYWEWSHRYEFIYSLYQYEELMRNHREEDADKIIQNFAGRSSISSHDSSVEKPEDVMRDLRFELERCRKKMAGMKLKEEQEKYGTRSERFREQLRHDVDDITISNIFSNYSAETALKYYQMSEEANTEGLAYKEMMGTMYFLDDDMNNDTNQFNIACDRFLLNCGIVERQRKSLERLYKYSNVYHLTRAYLDGPNKVREEKFDHHQFDRSQFINSEY
mgnify:CR=1 FL=1